MNYILNRRCKKALLKSIRFANNKLRCGATILGYHRISYESAYNPFELNVSLKNFNEQMEVLRKYTNPISMKVLINKMKENKIPKNAVVITFDDGYSDNYYRGKSILEKFSIPATVFVTTGDLAKEFWWDELERLTLLAKIIPEELNFQYEHGHIFWRLDRRRMENPRINLFFHFYNALHPLSISVIEKILAEFRNMVDPQIIPERKYRRMNENELKDFAQHDLIEIGSHTINHPNLKTISQEEQIFELKRSKEFLEQIINKPVKGFSFPHGISNKDSYRLLKFTGYEYACLGSENFLNHKTDLFHLPRTWVRDYDGDTFYKWLKRWVL